MARLTASLVGDLGEPHRGGDPLGCSALAGLDRPGMLEALPAVLKAAAQGDDRLRKLAFHVLAGLATSAPQTIAQSLPVMRDGLADPSPAIRAAAARALGSVGPKAKDSVPALIALLDASPEQPLGVRTACLDALGGVGPRAAPAVPSIMRVLEAAEKGREIEDRAVLALGAIGPAAEPAIPLIEKTFSQYRDRAIKSIRGVKP